MKRLEIHPESGFRVIAATGRSQAATMVLREGASTGGPENAHSGSDQWLFVISGRGLARVGDEEVSLEPGTLLLIESGETHEIEGAGGDELRTLNVYAPPAY